MIRPQIVGEGTPAEVGLDLVPAVALPLADAHHPGVGVAVAVLAPDENHVGLVIGGRAEWYLLLPGPADLPLKGVHVDHHPPLPAGIMI